MKEYNILWIDDDINSPELMPERDALEELGCRITPLSRPDGFRMETVPLYDCIIIDLSMPKGSMSIMETCGGSRTGFVLLKKIINKHPESKTKIVIYSVFDAIDVKSYCIDNGIEYWNKTSMFADDFALSIVEFIEKNII